jgi:transposase
MLEEGRMVAKKGPGAVHGRREIVGDIELVNRDAAGIDAGAREHWVSVPEDRAEQSVRPFGAFTEDLYALSDWLASCAIRTVAIEATGVYWIPLVEVLEARGFEVRLVDSRSIGRRNKKTDVLDCQWIRQLHSYGLLDSAFRPEADMLPLRAYMRQRGMLIRYASDHIRHMQKALDVMNLKLHTVVNDITGVTGMRIIEAILDGIRDPQQLASLRHGRCRNSEETIAKALVGNYREEHLFDLRVACELYATYQAKLAGCDEQIRSALEKFDRTGAGGHIPTTRNGKARRRKKNQPHFDGREMLREMIGVDLVAVDGLDVSTVLTIVSEVGIDLRNKFESEAHFVSWLGLAANNRVTGGRIMRQKGPRPRPNRASQAFRLAAQTVARGSNWLGAFFRRVQSRKGWAVAVKATGAKLARIFYSLVTNKREYDAPDINYYEQRYRANLVRALEKKALTLGYKLAAVAVVH